MAVIDNEIWRNFFDEFKNCPELWKVKSSIYKNKVLRDKAWLKLLEIYNKIDASATVNTVKNKITNLKSCYRRELKKICESEKSGAGADEVYVPSLWYFDLLDFIRDHEIPISGTSSLDFEDELETGEQSSSVSSVSVGSKRTASNKRKEYFLEKAVDHLNQLTNEKENVEEGDVFARGWAISFKKIASEEQKLFAKKAIDEVLLLGQLNKLSLNVVCPTPSIASPGVPTPKSTPSRSSTPNFISSRPSTPNFISSRPSTPNFISSRPSTPNFTSSTSSTPNFISSRPSTPNFTSSTSSTPNFISSRPSTPNFVSSRSLTPSLITSVGSSIPKFIICNQVSQGEDELTDPRSSNHYNSFQDLLSDTQYFDEN